MNKIDSTVAGRLLAATLIVAAVLLAAPRVIPAQARAATDYSTAAASSQSPPNLALTPPASTSPQSGSYTFGHAAPQSDPPSNPASTGPGPPTSNGKKTIPCPVEWCQKLIERFCHRIDCSKLAQMFRGTAGGSARDVLREHHDAAFGLPWDGTNFDAHHIVAQSNRLYGGIANFAQTLLERVGISADDIDNLAALRGADLQVGKPGYEQLPADLRGRMAHADTTFRYYYEKVNEQFATWIRSHGGRLPDASEVRQILRSIKADLYTGGRGYIQPERTPRIARRNRVALQADAS